MVHVVKMSYFTSTGSGSRKVVGKYSKWESLGNWCSSTAQDKPKPYRGTPQHQGNEHNWAIQCTFSLVWPMKTCWTWVWSEWCLCLEEEPRKTQEQLWRPTTSMPLWRGLPQITSTSLSSQTASQNGQGNLPYWTRKMKHSWVHLQGFVAPRQLHTDRG